jgi:hypothetical protein
MALELQDQSLKMIDRSFGEEAPGSMDLVSPRMVTKRIDSARRHLPFSDIYHRTSGKIDDR